MKCPSCGSLKVRRSIRRGLREGFFLRLAARAPFRCSQCGARYVGFILGSGLHRRKRHRDLASYFGFRGAQRNKLQRLLISIGLAGILIYVAIVLVLRLAEPGPPIDLPPSR